MTKRAIFTDEQIEAHRATIGAFHADVLILCQDANYADCALAAGVPIGTIKSRLNRARALLTDAIAAMERSHVQG